MKKTRTCRGYKLNYKPDLADSRDLLYKHVKPSGIALPPRVDLRSLCSPVEDQGSLGSCTANAIAGALEFLENKTLKENAPTPTSSFFEVSRLFTY